jgi:hypothetical protein
LDRLVSFVSLESAIQRGSGDLERLANRGNRVLLIVVERFCNIELPCCQGFWSTTYSPSGSGSYQTCGCSFLDEVSLKLRKRTKDMKD